MIEIIKKYDDKMIVNECVWGIYYFLESNNNKKDIITKIIEGDIISILINHMTGDESEIKSPCLKIFGRLSLGDNSQLKSFVDKKFYDVSNF